MHDRAAWLDVFFPCDGGDIPPALIGHDLKLVMLGGTRITLFGAPDLVHDFVYRFRASGLAEAVDQFLQQRFNADWLPTRHN